MGVIKHRSLDRPDLTRQFPLGLGEITRLGSLAIGRAVLEPGWRWSTHMAPVMGRPSCPVHHLQLLVAGHFAVRMDDGEEVHLSPNDVFEVPPGHDAWVIGDEAVVVLDMAGNSEVIGIPSDVERVLSSLLMTDIVDSTRLAATMGDQAWKQVAETPLDLRVCECCPTAVAVTADGPLVAYRDRSKEEVRDIYVTRLENGKWTEPKPVHPDGWKIPACPVNGPALSARGRDVAIAWFHAKDGQPRSLAALSPDAGRTFGPPIRVDDVASLGRVDVELLPDGSAAAAYMEFADQKASFRVRVVRRDGTRSDPVIVAGMAGNRSSGYPRMVLQGNELVFAWTERDGRASRVQTSVAALR